MSADNILIIQEQEDGSFLSFDRGIEDESSGRHPVFEARSMKDAVDKAQKYMQENVVEYGYQFVFVPKSNCYFITESNNIERELTYPEELAIYSWWLSGNLTENRLKELHKRLCVARNQLQEDQQGVYRKIPVYLGDKEMPKAGSLRRLMTQFFCDLPDLSPFAAHKRYESIHPFVDLNGRTGRAIWLHMMGGEARLGFLHTWYYQSLS